ncbi:MAG: hypothetical protein KatS3mg045_1930 [Bellilinea sp.]|nr:MAG: hypothetical protein KatS3mg045_1930 [Bellilinea sp.]
MARYEAYLAVTVPEAVRDRFRRLVERARPRGRWQLKLLLELASRGRVPASAARMLRGSAAAFEGRYQRSLENLMGRAGARLVLGPRGGRWGGVLLPTGGR